ncbi:membrane bound O-acyl transferase family-domain-containing protein [Akkermansiaceae bacterium]|nr:membrane bound O-acyl transferase family-domain-containing protein [Akkermansiaceae bacterium]
MEFDAVILAGALLIAILTNLLGKVLCENRAVIIRVPRVFWWMGILLAYLAVHLLMLEQPALLRMVGLCVTLLLGMKVIIYREWMSREGKEGADQQGRKMSWLRWLAFSFLWFGMNPGAWVVKRRKLEWKSHLYMALGCMLVGAIGLSLYVRYIGVGAGGYFFVLSFVFMSMMFHYGVLRALVAFWRWVGYPVRTLFRNPLVTTGFRDFWGARWNLGYSQMMARAVQKPLTPTLGNKGAVFAVFVVSGFFHELAITVPVQSGYGLPTLFFLFHGLAVTLEKKPTKWMGYLCLLSLVIGLPVLFPNVFVEEVILPVEEVWGQILGVFL